MSNFTLLVCSLVAALSLSACQEQEQNQSYEYLMTHPSVLKDQLASCQVMDVSTKELPPRCTMVIKAADQMLALMDDHRKNPEKFGQKILRAQMEGASSDNLAKQDDVRILLSVVGMSSPE